MEKQMHWRITGHGNIIALTKPEQAMCLRFVELVAEGEHLQKFYSLKQIRKRLAIANERATRYLYILSETIPTKCPEGTQPPLTFRMKQTKRVKCRKYYLIRTRKSQSKHDNN